MRTRITYANVVSTLCLFLLLAGGTAYALDGSNTVFTDDIVNGDVKVADIGQGAVATDEIANGQVKAADLGDGEVKAAEIASGQVSADELAANSVRSDEVADGQVRTQEIANGQVQAEDLAPGVAPGGASGARAYARVDPLDCTQTGSCTPRESKGVSGVRVLSLGRYCVTAPGIDANVTPAAVSVDWQRTDDPEGNASAMTREAGGCGTSGQGFEVATERQLAIEVDAGGGVNNAVAAGGLPDFAANVAFTIVIP